MSKFIVSCTFILLFKISFSQSSCLEDIKYGRFIHFSYDGKKVATIIRKKGRQTEYFSQGKNKLNVTWIKEDEYLLEDRKTKFKNTESRIGNVNSIIHVKVIGCYEEYYDFTAFILDEDGVVMEEVSARYYRGKR